MSLVWNNTSFSCYVVVSINLYPYLFTLKSTIGYLQVYCKCPLLTPSCVFTSVDPIITDSSASSESSTWTNSWYSLLSPSPIITSSYYYHTPPYSSITRHLSIEIMSSLSTSDGIYSEFQLTRFDNNQLQVLNCIALKTSFRWQVLVLH